MNLSSERKRAYFELERREVSVLDAVALREAVLEKVRICTNHDLSIQFALDQPESFSQILKTHEELLRSTRYLLDCMYQWNKLKARCSNDEIHE